MTEYAFALAKADRYQEAIDVLDLLDNPNTPRALNYRGYATRKLGDTDGGMSYPSRSRSTPIIRRSASTSGRPISSRQVRSRQGAVGDDREALWIQV